MKNERWKMWMNIKIRYQCMSSSKVINGVWGQYFRRNARAAPWHRTACNLLALYEMCEMTVGRCMQFTWVMVRTNFLVNSIKSHFRKCVDGYTTHGRRVERVFKCSHHVTSSSNRHKLRQVRRKYRCIGHMSRYL